MAGAKGSICVVQSAACSSVGSSLVHYRRIAISDGHAVFQHLEHVVVGVGNIPVLSSGIQLNGYKTPCICAMDKNFSEVYVLLGIASQSLNSLARKTSNAIKSWTALVINCMECAGYPQ